MSFAISRLKNSPYFCEFKYTRAVKQKVWNEAENGERDWGETPTPRFTDFFADFEEKKPTLLQFILQVQQAVTRVQNVVETIFMLSVVIQALKESVMCLYTFCKLLFNIQRLGF